MSVILARADSESEGLPQHVDKQGKSAALLGECARGGAWGASEEAKDAGWKGGVKDLGKSLRSRPGTYT